MTRREAARRLGFAVLCSAAIMLGGCGDGDGRASPTSTAEATASATATGQPGAETLAFLRDGDIWLIDADGSEERRLTELGNVRSFLWVTPAELDATLALPNDSYEHRLVNIDGSTIRLSSPPGGSWSNDGQLYAVAQGDQIVLFDRSTQVGEFSIAAPSGTGAKPDDCFATPPGPNASSLLLGRPVFTPDGEHVMVAANCLSRAGATGNLAAPIFEISLDGLINRETALGVNLGAAQAPRFSPDGQRLAVLDSWHNSACATQWWLTVAAADGSDAQERTIAAIAPLSDEERFDMRGGVIGYDWSPASDAIVVSVDAALCIHLTTPGMRPTPLAQGLYILALDGSSEEKLYDGATHSPAWSPSGEQIAFVAQEYFGEGTGTASLKVLDRATGDIRDFGNGTLPAWQPE